MITWINGAFAAGKTTLAEELKRRLDARAGLPADALVLQGEQHTPAELADLVLKSVATGGMAR